MFFFRLFTLGSACVSALVRVLREKMRDLLDFKRGQIIGARLAVASVTTAALLSV
jgi:hypothetical protein